jgi:hypothetical protein
LIFYTLYGLFQETKISPLRRADFKIYQHKNQKKIVTPQNKENAFSKIVLDIFFRSKTTCSFVNLKNYWTLLCTLPRRTGRNLYYPDWAPRDVRSCPGKHIARMEIQVLVVKLLQRFRIGKRDTATPHDGWNIFISPTDPPPLVYIKNLFLQIAFKFGDMFITKCHYNLID